MTSTMREAVLAAIVKDLRKHGLPAPRRIHLDDEGAASVHMSMDDPIEVDAWADHLKVTPVDRQVGLPGIGFVTREVAKTDTKTGIWPGWYSVRVSAVAQRQDRQVRP